MISSRGKVKPLSFRDRPYVDKELAGSLIDNAWITYVTKTLTTAETLGRPDVARELARIEDAGEVEAKRRDFRLDVDLLLDDLLCSPAKLRPQICTQNDLTVLALALDRVQCATFKLVETARPDRTTPVEAIQPLLDLFRNILHGDSI